MFTAVSTFLSGLSIGGLAAWGLFSFMAATRVHSPRSQDRWTVRNITARIERERIEANCTGHKSPPTGLPAIY